MSLCNFSLGERVLLSLRCFGGVSYLRQQQSILNGKEYCEDVDDDRALLHSPGDEFSKGIRDEASSDAC